MANRHLSRSVALQSLFEWDLKGFPPDDLRSITDHLVEEFAPGLEENSFIFDLINGVAEQRAKLDRIIVKAAPDWPIDKIAIVDRNVLRLGLYELLFGNRGEVPARVAINEAIELAKTFGGETSGKFVNGVLGAVYKEMGEPGKNDIPAKKKRFEDLPYDQLPTETLAGGVVYHQNQSGQVTLALVHDVFGYWTLSKGHLLPEETPEAGMIREVLEELSLPVVVEQALGDNEYVSSDPEKGKIKKRVSYFVARADEPDRLNLKKSGGLAEARWFGLEELEGLRMYDDIVPFITKAIKLIARA